MGKKFSKEHQPNKRGKAFKTKLLETIRSESLLDVSKAASYETVEKAYLSHLAKRAFDVEDQSSGTLLKELLSKSYASIKAVMPDIEFDYEISKSPVDQVNQIIYAASKGQIPPDIASIFIQSIKAASDIEINTELKNRIEKLEALVNGA